MAAPLPNRSEPPADLVLLLSAAEGSRDWALGMRHEIQACVREAKIDSGYVRYCLGALLRTRAWQHLRTSADVPFHSFHHFCNSPLPHGLGLTQQQVSLLGKVPARSASKRGKPARRPTMPGGAADETTPLERLKRGCLDLAEADREDLLCWLLGRSD